MDWTSIVRDFNRSGLSIRKYCQQENIPEHQLGYQIRKRKTTISGFVPLNVPVPKTIDPVWLAKFLKEVWCAQG
jgi:hypothetical protein